MDVYQYLLYIHRDTSKAIIKSITVDLPRTDSSNWLFQQVDAETIEARANPLFNVLYAYAMYDQVVDYH